MQRRQSDSYSSYLAEEIERREERRWIVLKGATRKSISQLESLSLSLWLFPGAKGEELADRVPARTNYRRSLSLSIYI